MNRTTSPNRTTTALAALAILGATSVSARAQWNPDLEMTELTLSALGHEGLNLWLQTDAYNERSTIELRASFDTVARTFDYHTVGGQTYMGQSISIGSTGGWDGELGGYTWSGHVRWGSQSYSVAGQFTVDDLRGDDKKTETDVKIDGYEGTISKENVEKEGEKYVSKGRFTGQHKTKGYKSAPVKDSAEAGGCKGDWSFAALNGDPGGLVTVNLDPVTTSGFATIEIGTQVVPEPSCLFALGLGCAGFIRRRRR